MLDHNNHEEYKKLIKKYIFFYYNTTQNILNFDDVAYVSMNVNEIISKNDFLYDFSISQKKNILQYVYVVWYKNDDISKKTNVTIKEFENKKDKFKNEYQPLKQLNNLFTTNELTNYNVEVDTIIFQRIYSFYGENEYKQALENGGKFILYKDEVNYLIKTKSFLFPNQYEEFKNIYRTEKKKIFDNI